MNKKEHQSQPQSAVVVETLDHEQDDAGHSQTLLHLLRGRQHWAIGLAAVLAAVGIAAGWMAVEPNYRSTGMVQISPEGDRVLHSIPETDSLNHFESYMDAQAELIASGPVMRQALQQPVWQRVSDRSEIEGPVAFRRHLEVEREWRRQVMEVSFTAATPEVAQAGTQAVIEAYRLVSQQERSRNVAAKMRALERRRDELVGQLAQMRQEREEAAGDYGPTGLTELHQQRLKELTLIENQIRRVRLRQQSLAGQDTSGAGERSIEQLAASDPQISLLLRQRSELENLLVNQRAMGMGENHRSLRQTRAGLASLNRQLEEYIDRVGRQGVSSVPRPGGDASRADMIALASPEQLETMSQSLAEQLADVERETVLLGRRMSRLAELDAQMEQRQFELQQTRDRIEALNIELPFARRVDAISMGDLPSPAEPANASKRVQFAGIGGLFGASLGFGMVLLVGLLDSRLRRIDEAQLQLPSVRLLGVLPTLPDEPRDPQELAAAAHSLHQVRTLLQLDQKEQGQAFVITSPGPGSGKTSVSTALGLSFAAAGSRTLLIDCDVIGGGLSERLSGGSEQPVEQVLRREGVLGEADLSAAQRQAQTSGRSLEEVLLDSGLLSEEQLDRVREAGRRGLFDACSGETMENCIVQTGIEGLSLLPLGAAVPEQVGDLSPAAARRLLAQARSRFDAVIVDTGPVLGSIEASMTAAEADGVVLVVSRGESKQLIRKAHEHLESLGAKVAGVVFNRARSRDLERSSYTSAASFSRRSQHRHPEARLDPAATARFGPVGSAVASCSRRKGTSSSNGRHEASLAG